MSLKPYWRPKVSPEGKPLPLQVKEALRQHPAYANNRAFWSGLYVALDEPDAIKEIIDYLDAGADNEIEVFTK